MVSTLGAIWEIKKNRHTREVMDNEEKANRGQDWKTTSQKWGNFRVEAGQVRYALLVVSRWVPANLTPFSSSKQVTLIKELFKPTCARQDNGREKKATENVFTAEQVSKKTASQRRSSSTEQQINPNRDDHLFEQSLGGHTVTAEYSSWVQ